MKSETSTIKCKAIFSDDRSHRMLLRHEWEKGEKSALSLRFNFDDDLINEENDKIIEQYAAMSDAIIIAWGSVGKTFRVHERQKELLKKIAKYSNKFYQIGEEGFHPLTPKVRNNWELIPYEMEENSDDQNY